MDTVASLVGGWGRVGQTGNSWVDVVAMGLSCSGGDRTQKEVLGPCRLSLGDCVTLPLCASISPESHTGGGNERFWGTPTLTVAEGCQHAGE